MAPHDVRAGTIGTSRAPGSVTGKHLRRDFLSTTSRAQLPYGGRSHSALTRPQRASWPASYPHAGAETTVRTVAVDAPALVTLARSPASAAARVFYSSFLPRDSQASRKMPFDQARPPAVRRKSASWYRGWLLRTSDGARDTLYVN